MTRNRTLHTRQPPQRGACSMSAHALMLCVALCFSGMVTGCQFFIKAATQAATESATYQTTPAQSKGSPDLVIQRASYVGTLAQPQRGEREERPTSTDREMTSTGQLRVNAELSLASPTDRWGLGEERSISLNVPDKIWTHLKVSGDCRLARGDGARPRGGVKHSFICSPSQPNQAQLEVSYTIAWADLTGHHVITEGERQYHIVHLAGSLGGEIFLGFSEPLDFRRDVTLRALETLKLFGHEVSGKSTFKEIQGRPQDAQKSSSDGSADAVQPSQSKTPPASKGKEKSSSVGKAKDEPKWRAIQWRNLDDHSEFSLFFSFGSWETSQEFSIQLPREPVSQRVIKSGQSDQYTPLPSQLITPLGSRFHRVGTLNLRRLQMKRIKELAGQLHFNALYPRARTSYTEPLVWITLPDHPNYTPPDLRRYGVVFMDESWFYLDTRYVRALPIRDQLRLYENLYVALGDTTPPQQASAPKSSSQDSLTTKDPRLLHALARWSALNHLSAEPSERPTQPKERQVNSKSSTLDLYKIDILHKLREIAGERQRPLTSSDRQEFSALLDGTLHMIQSWLAHQRSGSVNTLRDKLGQLVKDAAERDTVSSSLQEIGRQLNRIDSHLKPIFESFLSNRGLPLVHVKWTQHDKGDHVNVRFTLSQRPFISHEHKPQLKPAMWIIPVCLRLGIRDNPSRVHCMFLDQPERSDYELSLEAPLLWVHPNADQSGLYLWSLEDANFERLMESKTLNLTESISLIEMSSILLETSLGNPNTYLKAVQNLALAADHPIAITHLFKHLNQVVLYFGERGDQVGLVERWASGILQGVMMSRPRFTKPPLNHFTQLQLAQWDRSEVGMGLGSISKREKKMIRQFLRPTTNQAAFEEDIVKVDLEAMQYPLLIQALSGAPKLWKKLRRKLAESEDQPLNRLVVIRALVQFINPTLFHQTLDLLSIKPTDRSKKDTRGVEEPETQESNDGPSSQDENVDGSIDEIADQPINAGDDEDEDTDKSEDKLEHVSLRAEDALELVRLVRSMRARRLAWDWFISQQKPIEELIHYGYRSDLQEGVLRWASVICDESRLKGLKAIYRGALGFKQSSLSHNHMYLSTAQRCVKIRRLRSTAEAFIRSSLSE